MNQTTALEKIKELEVIAAKIDMDLAITATNTSVGNLQAEFEERQEQHMFNLRMQLYLRSRFGMDEHDIIELIREHIPEKII
jgi:hypothetical protein